MGLVFGACSCVVVINASLLSSLFKSFIGFLNVNYKLSVGSTINRDLALLWYFLCFIIFQCLHQVLWCHLVFLNTLSFVQDSGFHQPPAVFFPAGVLGISFRMKFPCLISHTTSLYYHPTRLHFSDPKVNALTVDSC